MTSLFSASWKNPGLTFYGLSRAAQLNIGWQSALSSAARSIARSHIQAPSAAWLAAASVFTTFDGVVTNGSVDATKLIYTSNSGAGGMARSTAQKNSGKWYFEVTLTALGQTNHCIAVIKSGATDANVVGSGLHGGIVFEGGGGIVFSNDASSGLTVGDIIALNDVIGVAVDLDNEKIWFRKSVGAPSQLWYNAAIGVQNPATNTGGASLSNYSGTTMAPACGFSTVIPAPGQWTANFGQSAFSLPAPSGFTSGWTV